MKKKLFTILLLNFALLAGCGNDNIRDLETSDEVESTDTAVSDLGNTDDTSDSTSSQKETDGGNTISEEEWKALYADVVRQYHSEHYSAGNEGYGYSLIYVDDDDVPELLASTTDMDMGALEKVSLYTVSDGKAVNVIDNFYYHGSYGNVLSYYEKTGIYELCLPDGGYSVSGYRLSDVNQSEPVYRVSVMGDTSFTYLDENNQLQEIVYPGVEYRELEEVPDVQTIKDIYGINDFGTAKEFDTEIGNYAQMFEYLGIADELSDGNPDYEVYAKLLVQFLNKDNAYFCDVQEAYAYEKTMDFAFGLYDLNKDGREELIVKTNDRYNLLVPADTWEDANLGLFKYYNPESGEFASYEGDLGEWYNYYVLENQQKVFTRSYEWLEGEDYNETTGEYDWYYYYITTDKDRNEYPSDENEYNSQPAKSWNEPDTQWYQLDEENVNKVLMGQ